MDLCGMPFVRSSAGRTHHGAVGASGCCFYHPSPSFPREQSPNFLSQSSTPALPVHEQMQTPRGAQQSPHEPPPHQAGMGWALTCRQMRARYPHTSALVLFRALASERASSASSSSSSLRERGEAWTNDREQAGRASQLNRHCSNSRSATESS